MNLPLEESVSSVSHSVQLVKHSLVWSHQLDSKNSWSNGKPVVTVKTTVNSSTHKLDFIFRNIPEKDNPPCASPTDIHGYSISQREVDHPIHGKSYHPPIRLQSRTNANMENLQQWRQARRTVVPAIDIGQECSLKLYTVVVLY